MQGAVLSAALVLCLFILASNAAYSCPGTFLPRLSFGFSICFLHLRSQNRGRTQNWRICVRRVGVATQHRVIIWIFPCAPCDWYVLRGSLQFTLGNV